MPRRTSKPDPQLAALADEIEDLTTRLRIVQTMARDPRTPVVLRAKILTTVDLCSRKADLLTAKLHLYI